jgi:serine protease
MPTFVSNSRSASRRPAKPAASRRATVVAVLLALFAFAASLGFQAPTAGAAPTASNEVVVKYAHATPPGARAAIAYAAGASRTSSPLKLASHTRLLRLKPGTNVQTALAALRSRRNVLWAVPNYVAHVVDDSPQAVPSMAPPAAPTDTPPTATTPTPTPAPGTPTTPTTTTPTPPTPTTTGLIPNDPGPTGDTPGGWQRLQWNFDEPFGVNAPQAWANVAAQGRPGGAGVIVAVLDTGVAYANHGRFRRSPDFASSQFVKGYDFVAGNAHPDDHNGHGTHVASTIAEETNNGYGLTGLAYGVRLMPVRVLNSQGEGDASVIAQGVRYAVRHGARVINLSLEFSSDVTASDIPELLDALRFAHNRGVLVVAAAGNEGHSTIAYPARAHAVVAVGATTEHGCLANFSNDGRGLTLVAPGGGADADLPGDPNCHPDQPAGRDIYQVTFIAASPRKFGVPPGYEGTSMASPHVAATAALVIASGVLGANPTPDQLVARLKATARKLGDASDQRIYGAGLIDAAAATAPGGPGAPPSPPTTTSAPTATG